MSSVIIPVGKYIIKNIALAYLINRVAVPGFIKIVKRQIDKMRHQWTPRIHFYFDEKMRPKSIFN